MARLQDFQSVTPAGSDNLLIVQSQGQGLATLNAAGQKVATETTISSLTTTSKNLVGAVNELKGITDNKLNVSDLVKDGTTYTLNNMRTEGFYSGTFSDSPVTNSDFGFVTISNLPNSNYVYQQFVAQKWNGQFAIMARTSLDANSWNSWKTIMNTSMGADAFLAGLFCNMKFSGNLNNVSTDTFSLVSGTNLTNAPNTDYFVVLTVCQDSNQKYSHQLAFAIRSTTLWTRACNNGTWTAWRSI